MTLPIAHIAYNGATLDGRGCPFAGLVTVHGPNDPALVGTTYRLLVRNVTAGGSSHPILDAFYASPVVGPGYWITPGAGGWTSWPTWNTNQLGTLGYFYTTGDDLWEIELEVMGAGRRRHPAGAARQHAEHRVGRPGQRRPPGLRPGPAVGDRTAASSPPA